MAIEIVRDNSKLLEMRMGSQPVYDSLVKYILNEFHATLAEKVHFLARDV